MISKLRRHAQEQKGFTLIELLVVILIIGILAAIAIPAFLNQKSKAQDAAAKTTVRTAATAAETLATDNNGSYATLSSPAQLHSLEPSINTAAGNSAYLSAANGTANTYTLVAVAPGSSDQFTITNTGTTSTHTCSPVGTGGCPTGSW